MMELQRDPSLLFKRVFDKRSGKYVELTEDQIKKLTNLIEKNRTFSGMDKNERPQLKFIDHTYSCSIYANNLPTKSQFVRKSELKEAARLAKLIKQGKLDPDDLDGYKALLKQH